MSERKIHYGAMVSNRGQVSPLCAKTPRAINLKRQSWTLQRDGVTCEKCKAAMAVKP